MSVELEVDSKKSRENKTFIFLLKSYSSLLITRLHEIQAFRIAACHSFWFLGVLVPLAFFVLAIVSSIPMLWEPFALSEKVISNYFQGYVPKESFLSLSSVFQSYEFIAIATFLGFSLFLIILILDIESVFKRIFEINRESSFGRRFLIIWASFTLGPVSLILALYLPSEITLTLVEIGWSKAPNYERLITLFSFALIFSMFFSIFYKMMAGQTISLLDSCIGGGLSGLFFVCLVFSLFYFGAFFPITQGKLHVLLIFPTFFIVVYLCFFVIILGGVLCSLLGNPSWEKTYAQLDTLNSLSLLIIAIQILGLLFVSSQSGETLSKRLIVFSLGVGEKNVDKAIQILHDFKFIKRSAAGNWILSRDLSSSALSELCQAFKFNIVSLTDESLTRDSSIYAIEVWRGRLIQTIHNLGKDKTNLEHVNIRDLLQGQIITEG